MALWTTWTKSVPATASDTDAILATEYSDHGQWARHYSTVRMTVGTFFLSAATGMLYLRWDHPDRATGIFALAIFLVGLFLFLRFTWLTYKEMNRQMDIVIAYRTLLKASSVPRLQPGFWRLDGAYIGLAFLVLFLSLEGWWMNRTPARSGQTVEFKIPVNVRTNGQAEPVTVEIPLRLTIP